MRNKIKNLFLSIFFLLSFFIPQQKVMAQSNPPCPQNEIATDLGCVPQDPIGFVERFYGIGLIFIGFVALLVLIIGGYYVMTSQGNPLRLEIGKQFIFYAIAGLVLAIMGFVIIEIIGGSILKIPGFS